jgi:hypothetical protein
LGDVIDRGVFPKFGVELTPSLYPDLQIPALKHPPTSRIFLGQFGVGAEPKADRRNRSAPGATRLDDADRQVELHHDRNAKLWTLSPEPEACAPHRDATPDPQWAL